MDRLTLSGLRPGHRTRRLITLLALALLCLTVVMVFAGAAFAAEGEGGVIITSNGTEIQTSEGMQAPELDYNWVWWSFFLTFGLLAVYYILVLRISNTEFKKIIDAHFGPKPDGR